MQTRPQFILSSERVLGGMESETMLTPREKSPLPRKKSPQRIEPAVLRQAGQRAQHTTNVLFRPPGPKLIHGNSRYRTHNYVCGPACEKQGMGNGTVRDGVPKISQLTVISPRQLSDCGTDSSRPPYIQTFRGKATVMLPSYGQSRCRLDVGCLPCSPPLALLSLSTYVK